MDPPGPSGLANLAIPVYREGIRIARTSSATARPDESDRTLVDSCTSEPHWAVGRGSVPTARCPRYLDRIRWRMPHSIDSKAVRWPRLLHWCKVVAEATSEPVGGEGLGDIELGSWSNLTTGPVHCLPIVSGRSRRLKRTDGQQHTSGWKH